jgi:glycine amidinotransferase
MNTLSLDEKRIVVEKQEEPFIRFLEDWGFQPIPVAYRNCYKHGGSFHCSTLDVRRRGELQSYFA